VRRLLWPVSARRHTGSVRNRVWCAAARGRRARRLGDSQPLTRFRRAASAADTAACAGCFGPFPHGGTLARCAIVFGAPQRVAGVHGASAIPPLTRFRRPRQRLTQRRAPVALALSARRHCGSVRNRVRRAAARGRRALHLGDSTSHAPLTPASAADTAACAGCFGPFPHGGTLARCAIVFGAPQRVAGVHGASAIPPLTRFRRARQRLTQRRAPVALARFRTAALWLGAQSCSARRSAWQACAAPRRFRPSRASDARVSG
jgi:hypothetical protein